MPGRYICDQRTDRLNKKLIEKLINKLDFICTLCHIQHGLLLSIYE